MTPLEWLRPKEAAKTNLADKKKTVINKLADKLHKDEDSLSVNAIAPATNPEIVNAIAPAIEVVDAATTTTSPATTTSRGVAAFCGFLIGGFCAECFCAACEASGGHKMHTDEQTGAKYYYDYSSPECLAKEAIFMLGCGIAGALIGFATRNEKAEAFLPLSRPEPAGEEVAAIKRFNDAEAKIDAEVDAEVGTKAKVLLAKARVLLTKATVLLKKAIDGLDEEDEDAVLDEDGNFDDEEYYDKIGQLITKAGSAVQNSTDLIEDALPSSAAESPKLPATYTLVDRIRKLLLKVNKLTKSDELPELYVREMQVDIGCAIQNIDRLLLKLDDDRFLDS